MTEIDYYQIAVTNARAQAARVARDYEPSVKVTLTVIGPDNVNRVPCGEATFPRCQADVFTAGVLTITNRDNESIVRVYQPGQWIEAVCYGYNEDIDYVLTAGSRR